MEEELIDSWKHFRLTEEEQLGLVFDAGFFGDLEDREKLYLLGLLISDKILNCEAFKTFMQVLWSTQ